VMMLDTNMELQAFISRMCAGDFSRRPPARNSLRMSWIQPPRLSACPRRRPHRITRLRCECGRRGNREVASGRAGLESAPAAQLKRISLGVFKTGEFLG
jgi:hypothetical protein